MKELLSILPAVFRTVLAMTVGSLLMVGLLGAIYFPYATDDPNEAPPPLELSEAYEFYEDVYTGTAEKEAQPADHVYVTMGRDSSESVGITDVVEEFVTRHDLQSAKVLEIGAGSGMLQDVVEDYTGLDIAASAARYFHKTFVHGSATDLPFDDNHFDAIWTIWTLEHVPNPERAPQEMRRVVKPGGFLLLIPAWYNTSWAAHGYRVRPYSDLALAGKLVKASLILRTNLFYQYAHIVSVRAIRRVLWTLGGEGAAAFRYRRLEPNYEHYWEEDSDAVNSLDPHEVMLWHVSRGDECVNCPKAISEQLQMVNARLEIRVNKR